MAGVRALMERVRRLEQSRTPHLARIVGTPEEFTADCQRGIVEGIYDECDMTSVMNAVLRWIREGL